MRHINLLLGISALFLVSCSSRINNFSAQKYTHFQKGNVVSIQNQEDKTHRENIKKIEAQAIANIASDEIILEQPSVFESKSENKTAEIVIEKSHFISVWNNLDKQERKEVVKTIKSTYKSGQKEHAKTSVDALELICAIFIPPLGVFLHEGEITNNFWIDLILTILFFIPGMIFAILVVTDNI